MNYFITVVAVANGLEAWRIIEDLSNHIDLVLTEVVMPCLTGVALLSMIKSHKTCKNIPVISEYRSCFGFRSMKYKQQLYMIF